MKPTIPDSALDDRLAFVGTSGSGKTYAAGTAVERLLSMKARVVVVDPLDVWYGLRLKQDGVRPAFPVVIFGGSHADLPLNEPAGGLIGETVASMAESCIISLGGFGTKSAERRFMLAFLERLFRRATGEPFHIVFDEADLWAPQKSSEPHLQSLMEQIVRRGRVKGFIPWLITQRPAVLSKDVLSQADGLVAMKLTSSQDRDAIGGWIEGQADRSDEKRMLARLPQLARGRGMLWIPGRGILEEVQFPAKETFDSSRTPKRGEMVRSTSLKPIDLGAVRARLAAIESETAKPKAPAKAPLPNTPAQLEPRALREAEDAGRRIGFEDGKRVGYAEGYRDALRTAQLAVAAVKAPEPNLAAIKPRTMGRVGITPTAAASVVSNDLPAGERRCLIAIAQHRNGIRREQMTVLTGFKRSTRDAYIQRLRQRGHVEVDRDRVVATTDGIAALGSNYDPLPTGSALRERVLHELPDGEHRVLEILLSAYPNSVERTEIDVATEFKRSTRDAYIQRLRLRQLIETTGGSVRAVDDLFDENAA